MVSVETFNFMTSEPNKGVSWMFQFETFQQAAPQLRLISPFLSLSALGQSKWIRWHQVAKWSSFRDLKFWNQRFQIAELSEPGSLMDKTRVFCAQSSGLQTARAPSNGD